MDTPNPKRLCLVPSVTSSIENASSLPITPGCNQSNIDMTISSFLSLSDLPLFSSPLSIGCSFDRVLDKVIPSEAGTSRDEFDQDRFLDRTLQLASLLYKSTKRCIRKRATLQNSISWPLLPEITIKVFSMLDTKSLMQASACCTMFNKCAMDRVCYSHIDLTTAAKHVDNGVVCIMIHRAGRELRSLKLGSISPSAGYTASLLTRSCLTPLTFNHGFAGGLLRSLHLYCLSMMDIKSLSPVLSACLNLTDLKIVGLSNPVEQLVSLTRSCRLLEYLFIESYIGASFPTDPSLLEVVDNCPNLISLTLLRFRLNDTIAQKLIKGFRRLEYINLSSSPEMNGSFLRGLGLICKDSPLETLILRNCYTLKEREVLQFLNSLLARDFKSIKLIDVSSAHGLVSDERKRTFEPRFPIEELKKQRSDVRFVAIFESQSSRTEEVYSDGTSSGSYNYSSEEEEQEREHEEEEEEEEEEHDNELEDKMNADLTISAAQCHPDCVQANNAQEDYDASQSAAYVAVSLISSARVILKLDSKYTEYSAQYLVDNAGKEEVMRREMPRQSYEVSLENCLRSLTENVWHKWEDGQGSYCWRSKKKDGQGSRHELTVSKTALNFAFKKGLPTKGQWTHFGCTFNAPSFNKPRVPMNGQVIEAADLGEALKLCRQQPVGARPMCSVPSLILLERRIYEGPSGDSSRYVGLRDAFIVAFDKREGKIVVTVQIVYKKKTSFVKVSGRSMMLPLTGEDGSQVTEPTCLLVDFCLPRLSIN